METTLPNIIPNPTTPHDSWAQWYDHVYETIYGSLLDKMTEATLKVMDEIVPRGNIVDYGSGTGRISIPLAKRGYSVHAVERSAGMVEILSSAKDSLHLNNMCVHHCSINEYSGSNADMSLVMFTVMNYLNTKELLISSLENIRRCTSMGGHVFFDLAGTSFFGEQPIKIEYNRGALRRSVEISPLENGQYWYSENCQGKMGDTYFSYADEFALMFWSPDFVLRIMYDMGFKLVRQDFPFQAGTGSNFFLLQKIQ